MRIKRGMGTWYLRGNIWWIKFFSGGKAFRESSYSTKESDAKQLLKSRLGEIQGGSFAGLGFKKLTLDDLCRNLLSDYRINQRKSYWRAEVSVEHLKKFFGGMKAYTIETPLIRKYIEERQAEGAKNGTVNRELAALRRMFRLAEEEGRLQRVPHFPMLQEDSPRSGFLEPEGYQKVKAELPGYLKPILVMAYWTGCRKSEILKLKWSQVDFLNRQISLEPKDTKNGAARLIPMPQELYQTFLSLRTTAQIRGVSGESVFTNRGRPIHFFYDAWKSAVRRAGFPDLLLHDCRRSAVRNFVRAGVSDKIARAISGHRTRSVFDRYNIIDERDLREATAKLERHLGNNGLGTVWAQNQHLQPQPGNSELDKSDEGKASTH